MMVLLMNGRTLSGVIMLYMFRPIIKLNGNLSLALSILVLSFMSLHYSKQFFPGFLGFHDG